MTDDTTKPIVSPDDIDYQRAYNGYANVSFSPEVRAKSVQTDYVNDVLGLHADMLKLCASDAQRAILAEEIERYRLGYIQRIYAVLDAKSRVVSTMIAGPANFPVERMRKRAETENKRLNEFLDWRTKAHAAIHKKILAARSEQELQQARWRPVAQHIFGNLTTIAQIDAGGTTYNRASWVNSIIGQVERLAARGEVELVELALNYVEEYNKSHKKPAIGSRSSFWSLLDVAKAVQAKNEQAQASDTGGVLHDANGVKIVDNAEVDRIQIVFPGKPNEKTIGLLKRSGWNWSPRNGAWQRQRTENARRSAREIVAQSA